MARTVRLTTAAVSCIILMGAMLGAAQPAATGTVCNTDGSSANIAFSTTTTQRIITTNMCPNHAVRTINPNAARQNSFFGVTNQQYAVPLKPQLASAANIVNVTCFAGPIGFIRSGATMFSVYGAKYCGDDAVIAESQTFDECNGHSEGSGMYHYHMTPGCTLLSAGYSSSAHSPILGYMLDGIPVYGPLSDSGKLPTDLDACGGHASDSGNNGQYHYHTKPIKGTWPDPATPTTSTSGLGGGWPYTPGCLRGCVDLPYSHILKDQGLLSYSSYSECAATGGTTLSNVEGITSATASGVSTTASAGTTAAPKTTTAAPISISSATPPNARLWTALASLCALTLYVVGA